MALKQREHAAKSGFLGAALRCSFEARIVQLKQIFVQGTLGPWVAVHSVAWPNLIGPARLSDLAQEEPPANDLPD